VYQWCEFKSRRGKNKNEFKSRQGKNKNLTALKSN